MCGGRWDGRLHLLGMYCVEVNALEGRWVYQEGKHASLKRQLTKEDQRIAHIHMKRCPT